jgi:hypothetical protein
MSQEPRSVIRPAVERRTALWPWLLMPLAALAIFLTLERMRHAPLPHPPGGVAAGAAASSDANDDQ